MGQNYFLPLADPPYSSERKLSLDHAVRQLLARDTHRKGPWTIVNEESLIKKKGCFKWKQLMSRSLGLDVNDHYHLY